MKFFSTRDPKICRTPAEAIAEGIAPDGGLYLPESFPAFPMEALSSMSGDDISVAVLSRLFDDFSEAELRASVMAAYDESFDNGAESRKIPGTETSQSTRLYLAVLLSLTPLWWSFSGFSPVIMISNFSHLNTN